MPRRFEGSDMVALYHADGHSHSNHDAYCSSVPDAPVPRMPSSDDLYVGPRLSTKILVRTSRHLTSARDLSA